MANIVFLTNSTISSSVIEWLSQSHNVEVYKELVDTECITQRWPDIVVSYAYRYILPEYILRLLPGKFINMHLSFLPHNRGEDPHAWSILSGTPHGVSIHRMSKEVDRGDILVQKRVYFDEDVESVGSSFSFLLREADDLFKNSFDDILDEKIIPFPQVGKGTVHRAKDLYQIREALLREEGLDCTIRNFRERYRKYEI